MSTYLVTFRIGSETVGSDTYSDRYNSFCEQVKKGATSWWGEPTSFYAVTINETIDEYCRRIWLHSKFSAASDLYLVVDAEYKIGRVRGVVKNQDLFKVLPFVTKL